MASFPLVSATGMLGSGFRPESLDKAISLGARMIGCDAGSTDPGPGPLATGTCMFSAAAQTTAQRAADDNRREDQRRPITKPQRVQQKPRAKSAQHVLRAVREVDDVEEPEDDREPEAQQRVKGAVDQPHQKLREHRRRGRDGQVDPVEHWSGKVYRLTRGFFDFIARGRSVRRRRKARRRHGRARIAMRAACRPCAPHRRRGAELPTASRRGLPAGRRASAS